MDKETREELKKIEEIVTHADNKISEIAEAFPVDKTGKVDVRGHRDYHEAAARAARAQEKFWNDLRSDLIRKGVWAVIIVAAGLILTGLHAKFGFPK